MADHWNIAVNCITTGAFALPFGAGEPQHAALKGC
jgi:hypothetical protein